jgi:hypothetical protein
LLTSAIASSQLSLIVKLKQIVPNFFSTGALFNIKALALFNMKALALLAFQISCTNAFRESKKAL